MNAARPLSVVHVAPSLDRTYGGPATSVPSLALALRCLGVEGALVSVDQPAPQSVNSLIETSGLVWLRARPSRVRTGYYSSALRGMIDRAVRDVQADVIHVHSFWGYPAAAAAAVARARSVALVVSPRSEFYADSLKRSRPLKRAFQATFGRGILKQTAFVHATEPGEADAARLLGYEGSVVVAPNGVDASIGDEPMDPAEALARLGLTGSGSRALFLARLHPRKGLDALLSAWARARMAGRGWTLMIAGDAADAAYASQLRQMAVDLGIADSIAWLGYADGPLRRAALSVADLFVLPSHFENFGLSIAEALACGVPVITTTATPWPALESDGAGWLVPPRDEATLAQALSQADAVGRNGLAAMSAAARQAVRHLGWAEAARPLAEAYRTTVPERTSADVA